MVQDRPWKAYSRTVKQVNATGQYREISNLHGGKRSDCGSSSRKVDAVGPVETGDYLQGYMVSQPRWP
jgi:hypothetical protein